MISATRKTAAASRRRGPASASASAILALVAAIGASARPATAKPAAPVAASRAWREAGRYTLVGAATLTPPGFAPPIAEGGFSSLARIDDRTFWTISDRGPTALVRAGKTKRRTTLVPSFAPAIYKLGLEPGGELRILERIPLRLPPGAINPARSQVGGDPRQITGLSSFEIAAESHAAKSDQRSYDAAGKTLLAVDPYGVDTEALAAAPDGTFWLAEEYRPSILRVAADGTLLGRLIPAGTTIAGHDAVPLQAILPAEYARRRPNLGFEGLTISPDGRRLWVALESPLAVACKPGDDVRAYRNSRILELDVADPEHPTVTREYIYRLDPDAHDRIRLSDLAYLAPGKLLADEHSVDPRLAAARIYEVDLDAATDVKDKPHTCIEALDAGGLAARGIRPAAKQLYLDLPAVGYDFLKPEGVAPLPDGGVAVIDDNDFGFAQDPATRAVTASGAATQLRIYQPVAPGSPAQSSTGRATPGATERARRQRAAGRRTPHPPP